MEEMEEKQSVSIYIGDFKDFELVEFESVMKKFLQTLPLSVQNEFRKYKKTQDKYAFIIGRFLLIYGISKFGNNSFNISDLRYTKYRKPYLPGGINFNISHSGTYAVCAISDSLKLGVDIETIKPLKFEEFCLYMTKKEWKEIMESKNSLHTFYKFWTKKESVLKAEGKGFYIPINEITIIDSIAYHKKNTWYLCDQYLKKDFCLCLATNIKISEIKIIEINLLREIENLLFKIAKSN